MAKRNYLFTMKIAEQDLTPSKNPPLCDSCSDPFPKDQENTYDVVALVLGNGIWGLLCPKCQGYHRKLPRLTEKEVPKNVLRALHAVLGRPMRIITIR